MAAKMCHSHFQSVIFVVVQVILLEIFLFRFHVYFYFFLLLFHAINSFLVFFFFFVDFHSFSSLPNFYLSPTLRFLFTVYLLLAYYFTSYLLLSSLVYFPYAYLFQIVLFSSSLFTVMNTFLFFLIHYFPFCFLHFAILNFSIFSYYTLNLGIVLSSVFFMQILPDLVKFSFLNARIEAINFITVTLNPYRLLKIGCLSCFSFFFNILNNTKHKRNPTFQAQQRVILHLCIRSYLVFDFL